MLLMVFSHRGRLTPVREIPCGYRGDRRSLSPRALDPAYAFAARAPCLDVGISGGRPSHYSLLLWKQYAPAIGNFRLRLRSIGNAIVGISSNAMGYLRSLWAIEGKV